jgi:hypothetical protein
LNLLTPDEIKAAVAIAERQARERTEMGARHVNERRELQAKHLREQQTAGLGPVVPTSSSGPVVPSRPRRKNGHARQG